MGSNKQRCQQGKGAKRPLDQVQLRDLALAYAARYATSAARLERYLARKLRERGWAEEAGEAPDVAALVARFAELGYIDDAAFARMRGTSLLRRGYGARRVDQALGEAGIDRAIRDEVAAGEGERRQAALTFARKRRFGPFGRAAQDGGDAAGDEAWRARREKQLAAMVRAGHSLDTAREMVDAASIAEAEEWAAAATDHDEDGDARTGW